MTGILSGPASVTCFVKEVLFPYRKHHFLGRGCALVVSSPGLGLSRIFSYGSTIKKKNFIATPRISLSPVMVWQDCSSVIEADVSCSVAYECYSNKELIPQWMTFISSVKVLKDNPVLSLWSLKYEVFGRNVEFSWLARNMQPIPNQKIHWRSLEGLPNRSKPEVLAPVRSKCRQSRKPRVVRGAVRFYPRGPTSCRIELTVSYEVPEILAPVAAALKPFLEGLLLRGLDRFVAVAKEYQKKVPQS